MNGSTRDRIIQYDKETRKKQRICDKRRGQNKLVQSIAKATHKERGTKATTTKKNEDEGDRIVKCHEEGSTIACPNNVSN